MKELKLSHISTTCLIRSLLRNVWMIVASAMIFYMAASLYLDTLWTPQYQASMTYAVRSRTTSIYSSSSSSATREVASVLSSMLPTNMVNQRIRDYDEALEDFDGSISASRVGTSNFVVVTCQDDSPKDALLSLMALEEILPELTTYISSNAVILVVRNPSVSGGMVNALNVTKTTRTAAFVGGVLMTALLVWFFLQRETVQTRTGARHLLDAHILATVSRVRRPLSPRSLLRAPDAPLQVFSPTANYAYSEQISTICTKLENEHAAHQSKVFMFTGVGENEGKSTISGNVAAALAMRGNRVAIVDCDLRNPSLKQFFNNKYDAAMPLNELLAAPFSRDNLAKCMLLHDQLGLYMLFSHKRDPRCTELLTSRSMTSLLQHLRVCDYIILDMPPMGYFADTEAIMDRVDASVLVVRQDRTPACDINDNIDLLRSAKSKFLGVVLNDMTGSLTEGYHHGGYGYGYGRYGYGYGYGEEHRKHHSEKTLRKEDLPQWNPKKN